MSQASNGPPARSPRPTMPPPLVQRNASSPERGVASSHDDRPIGRDAVGSATERSAREIAQADHAAAARPAKRLAVPDAELLCPTTTDPSAETPFA